MRHATTNHPRFATYVVVDAHTGHIYSEHDTRAEAKAAKEAVGDHALRVRGGKSLSHAGRTGEPDKTSRHGRTE